MHTTSHTPNTSNVNTTDHTFVAMVGKHHVGVDAALNKQVREAGHEWPWCRHLHHTHTFVVVIGEPVNATVCVKPWAAVASVGDALLAGVARVVVVHDTTWFEEWDVEQDAVVTHLALVVWHGVEVTGDVVAHGAWRMARWWAPTRWWRTWWATPTRSA